VLLISSYLIGMTNIGKYVPIFMRSISVFNIIFARISVRFQISITLQTQVRLLILTKMDSYASIFEQCKDKYDTFILPVF
jgi:hypothetical protein